MEVKAPNDYDKQTKALKVFLGGAIDMGEAVDWQKDIANHFKDNDGILLLNPRRDNWDSSWEQSIENEKFREQVEWELDSLDDCDVVVMVLTKDSKAPISLLELGLHAEGGKVILLCEEGFYRQGNVDIIANRYDVDQVTDIDELKDELQKLLDGRNNITEMLNRFS